MPEPQAASPEDFHLSQAEGIALAYYRAARLDGWAALVAAVEDALADLRDAERRVVDQQRLISRGYVRGRAGAA